MTTHPTQRIRFCTARDGVSIAYATAGSGPPVVRAPHWMTHLEFDWEGPYRAWLSRLLHGRMLVRYDMRGCGLSDRDGIDFTFERFVDDLETVADAAELTSFALFGSSGGGPIALAYAARHPHRVSHLVLHGAFARGVLLRTLAAEQREVLDALIRLIELGWAKENPAFRQLLTSRLFPDGTAEQFHAFNELQKISTSAANAAAIVRAFAHIDLRATARASDVRL